MIDLYEASEHNGPVLHYYVVVVDHDVARYKQPNDFTTEQVFLVSLLSYYHRTGGSVVGRTSDLRLSVVGSISGHDTAWLFLK